MSDYQWEILEQNKKPAKNISDWESKFGPIVIERNHDKTAKKVRFQVFIDNSDLDLFLVGDFNDWGRNLEVIEEYKFQKDEHGLYATLEIEFKHKDRYKFLVNNKNQTIYMEDPAASYFDDDGNCIFWDFEDPTVYKQKHKLIDNFERSVKIMQTDLPGLISHWKNEEGKLGSELHESESYKFIARSGVIKKIKELGFNTVQFLPFAQSIDGSNWKFRYLVPFQFAIQKNWGTPDDFAEMIDAFHAEGIAVIGDFVLGHLPHKDFNVFGKGSIEHGIHTWMKQNRREMVYLKEQTNWGTMRIDFDNPHVRHFFISSCIHYLKHYRVDGFRIDNVDGIIRYGPNGDGDERPNGRIFLRELNQMIYDYNPCAMINYEAHYYYGDNAMLLVAHINSGYRALGATAYNSSRITYHFHTEYMFKSADQVSIWRFKEIEDEKTWGKSNSTIADFHNHDAAAGLMDMRCTGSYAIDSMYHNHTPKNHAIGKIKVMEGIISLCLEGRTLNLLQTFLIQPGTFEHDSSIQWFLENNEDTQDLINFKANINFLIDEPSFWPKNVKYRHYLNIDDKNKVLVVERSDGKDKYIVLINTSDHSLYKYKIGLREDNDYEIAFNSNSNDSIGTLKNKESRSFQLLDREIELEIVGPYEVLVLKRI